MLVTLPILGSAQISTSHRAEKVEETVVVKYDSTKNFLGKENVTSYIGQILYVNGVHESSQEYGYRDFKTEKEPPVLECRYGKPSKKSQFNTLYEDLVGKYFIVEDVQHHSQWKEDKLIYGSKYWFKLKNRDDSNDVCWYQYDGEYEHSFPFITLSYFNYLKTNIGKKFVAAYTIKDGEVKSRISSTEFNTGETITQSKDDRWECIDVTIEDEYYYIELIIKNQEGQVSSVNAEDLFPLYGRLRLYEESEYNALVKKYGADNMDRVRQQKIKVGMPKELLIMSWGEPDRINRSSAGPDQYVYDDQYVYVEGGKITAWN